MHRLWTILFGMLIAVALTTQDLADAQIRMPKFGKAKEIPAPEGSLLRKVKDKGYDADCTPDPVTPGAANSAVAFDLVSMLAGKSRAAAADGIELVAAPKTVAELDIILQDFVRFQPPSAGDAPSIVIDEIKRIDARTKPDNRTIVLTAGLVNAVMSSERNATEEQKQADLAFIVAHEYAHILMCHFKRAEQVTKNRQMLGNLAVIGMSAALVGQVRVQDMGANSYQIGILSGNKVRDGVFAALAGYTVLETFNSSLINPVWSQDQEKDADWLAVELMSALDYPTTGVGPLLETLKNADETIADQAKAVVGSLPQQALSAAALTMSMNTDDRGQTFMTTMGIGLGVDIIQRWRQRQLGHFHTDPARRGARAQKKAEQIAQFFAERGAAPTPTATNQFQEAAAAQAATDAPLFQMASLTTRQRTARTESARKLSVAASLEMQALALAQEAQVFLKDKNIEEGCSKAQMALTAAPALTQAQRAAATCALAREDVALAARHMDAVVRSPMATPGDHELASQCWAGANNRARAVGVLEEGGRKFGLDGFYASRINRLLFFQDKPAARTVATQCQANTQLPEVKAQCDQLVAEIDGVAPAPSGMTTAASSPAGSTPSGANGLVPSANPLDALRNIQAPSFLRKRKEEPAATPPAGAQPTTTPPAGSPKKKN